jgi:hypothetical protein
MESMITTAEMIKKRLCKGDNAGCARFLVFSALGRENVPADLYPTNMERARLLLSQTG